MYLLLSTVSDSFSYLQKFLHIPDLSSLLRTVLHVIVDPGAAYMFRGRLCRLLVDDDLRMAMKSFISSHVIIG